LALKREKVDSEASCTPAAPAHLSARARAIWTVIVDTGRARSRGRQVLLQAALESLDLADQARAAIVAEGLTATTKGTGMVHVHPLVPVEQEYRRQFLAAWRILHLDWDTRIDAVPF
jgi:phage terminase small subunit